MNDQENKRPNTEHHPSRLSIVPGITVIAVALAVGFIAIFFFLWRSDRLVVMFGNVFFSNGDNDSDENDLQEIYLPGEQTTAVDAFDYNPDFTMLPEYQDGMAELLSEILPDESYQQRLFVSYNEQPAEEIMVFRDGDRYRVESDGFLVICDGETVYMRQEINSLGHFEQYCAVSESTFSLGDETGVPTLGEIIEKVKQSETKPQIRFDSQDKLIILNGITAGDKVMSVRVAYETGIVSYASTALADGTYLYRCFSMECTLNPEFAADTFVVPLSK